MTEFSTLNLSPEIASVVAAEGYTAATPIQAKAIPHILQGRDLLGIAQTGTGKTAAFALPILDALSRDRKAPPQRGARVLVLAPTRELAGQIAASFKTYGRSLHPSIASVFGGVPMNRQIRQMERGVDILVATPGRLLDLIDQRAIKLGQIEVLVLDEADQMLDLGFIHALRRIVPMLPASRQTLFFSATMPKSIAELAAKFLTDPVQVSVAPSATTAERVEQAVMFVPQAQKAALLVSTLRDDTINRVLVFSRTKHGADKIVRHLERERIESVAIHGNKSQPQRERALKAFKTGQCKVLVATDIAARGIDIDDVSHVINYDMPNVAEQYVHRIGRTARAGASGLAISFVGEDEGAYLRDIEKLTRQAIPVHPASPAARPEHHAHAPAQRPDRSGRGKPRPNNNAGHKRRGSPKANPNKGRPARAAAH